MSAIVTVSFPEDLLRQIEAKRGLVPRSAFIRELVIDALEKKGEEPFQAPGPRSRTVPVSPQETGPRIDKSAKR